METATEWLERWRSDRCKIDGLGRAPANVNDNQEFGEAVPVKT